MNLNKTHKWIWDVLFILLGCAGTAFILWKCRYGFANMDETFYLLTPYRLCQGDALFAEEWHLSQMSAFLMYPVMKSYLLLGGSFEGIFLNFRYIYTVFHVLVSVFIYIRLRPDTRPGAGAAALAYLLYAPFGIMALSYNSMGIGFLSLSLVIMYSAKRARRVQEVIAGLLFAAAVLCSPYLIAVFFIYLIASVIVSIVRRRKESYPVFNMKSWLFFAIGAAVLAAVFAAFVLSRADMGRIIASFPHILNDESHEARGIVVLFLTYFRSILALSKAADLSYMLLVVLFIVALADSRSGERGIIYLATATLFTIVAIVFMVWYGSYINYVMFPINIMAPVCAAVCKKEQTTRLLLVYWLPGMLYTFCIHASSNMAYYAISSAASVSVVPSMVIIAVCAGEILKSRANAAGYAAVIIAAVLFVGQIGTIAVMRYRAVFWGSMDDLQETVETEGIQKGIYISRKAKKQYDITREIGTYIEEVWPGEGNLLVLSAYNSIYLECPEKKNAAISGWLLELDATVSEATKEKLLAYYEMNPHKIPDVILIDGPIEDFIDELNTVAHYEVVRQDWGAFVLVRED